VPQPVRADPRGSPNPEASDITARKLNTPEPCQAATGSGRQWLSATVTAGSHDTETTVSHKEPVRRLGNANAEPDRISHKSTDQAAEIPPDGRETLQLIPVPVWNRHLLSQHTVFELQIALGLPAGHTLVGGDGFRPQAGVRSDGMHVLIQHGAMGHSRV
jgi:hypothetical protein